MQQIPLQQQPQQAPQQQNQVPIQQQNLAPMQQQQAVNQQIPVQGQPQQQYMPQQQQVPVQQQQAPFQQQPLQQQPNVRKQPVVQQRPLLNPVQKQAAQQPVAASLGSKIQQHQQGKKDSKEPPLQKPKLDGGAGRDLKEVRSRREVPLGEEEVLLKEASFREEEALHNSAPGDGKENLIPDIACFNDPQCAEKFSRNPVSRAPSIIAIKPYCS